MIWHNVEDWGIEGKGWSDTKRYYHRLPDHAEGVVRDPVWSLSHHSAGMQTRFVTNAREIHIKTSLYSDDLALPHMPATGVSGFDLYAEDPEGLPRWVGVNKPEIDKTEYKLAAGLTDQSYLYTIYLPLYNGVNSLEIGVPTEASFEMIGPRDEKPIVFYGTSIMQGACASRPGMAFSNILGRRLNKPTINLGFSGNGRMEPEVGSLLAELNPALYVIDCLPNLRPEQVTERAHNLVMQLKQKDERIPLLLVEDRVNTNAYFIPERALHHQNNRKALREVLEQLRNEQVPEIYYLQGDLLLGSDGEGATDGSHPNDLGMVRYADAYHPVLSGILGVF